MSFQLSSVPGGGKILIILIAGIRVLVYDRKKEARGYNGTQRHQVFQSEVVYSEPFSEQTQLFLILRLLS